MHALRTRNTELPGILYLKLHTIFRFGHPSDGQPKCSSQHAVKLVESLAYYMMVVPLMHALQSIRAAAIP